MSTVTRYTPRYGPKKGKPTRRAVLPLDRVLLVVGTVLVLAFLAYGLYSTVSGLRRSTGMVNVFSGLAMLGVVVMLAAVTLRRWKRARRAATFAGFAMLGSFVGYGLYNAIDTFVHHRAVGNAFAVAGMCGLMLLLAAGALQRVRS